MALNNSLPRLPVELHIEILANLTLADQLRASQAFSLWSRIFLNNDSLRRTRYATVSPGIRGFHQLVSHPGALVCTIVDGAARDYLYVCNEEPPVTVAESDFEFEQQEQQEQLRFFRKPRFDISEHPILDEPIISSTMFPNATTVEEPPVAGEVRVQDFDAQLERQPHYALERDYYGSRETVQAPKIWAPVDGLTVREFVENIAKIAQTNSPDWVFLDNSRLDPKIGLLFWHGWDGEDGQDEDALDPALYGILYYTLK